MTKQERYQHYTVDPVTGEKQYYYPMEIEVDPKMYDRKIDEEAYDSAVIYRNGLNQAKIQDKDGKDIVCEVGYTRLGNREFKAVFIPVSHEEFKELIKDEMHEQERAKEDGRCIIPSKIGGYKRCPRKIPNPNYVEGGDMPKEIMNSCKGCIYEKKKCSHTIVNFTDNAVTNGEGEVEEMDPISPNTYYAGDEYEELIQKWCAFVRTKAPELEELAMLLSMEYIRSEAARELGKSGSTVQAQRDRLKRLLLEFLQNIATM